MLKNMQLATAPTGVVDPVTQGKVRRRMLEWYVSMGHVTHFDDTATRRSHGDLKLANKPTIRDYLIETVSVPALVVGIMSNGTA